ncbi:MAG TPA: hypothetical protein VF230_16885 [Acidimicrobiales bacterium]
MGSFCGSYDATQFLVGGECHGDLGGNEMAMATVGPPAVIDGGPIGDEDTIDDQVGDGDWSIMVGPLMLGGATCTTGSYGPDGVGAIALVAVPMPLFVGGAPYPPSACAPPNRQPPPAPVPDPGEPAAVWFCELFVTGVVVMESI